MSIAKIVGNLDQLVVGESEINRYILQGLFQEVSIGGEVSNLEEDFYIRLDGINFIMITSLEDGRLKIQFSVKKDAKSKEISSYMTTKYTLVLDYFGKNFPMYNSEY